MQAAFVVQHGNNDQLRVGDYTDPVAGKGRVVVKVHAASVNPIDWKVGQGYFRLIPGQKMPCILGSDCSGVVESLGPGVTDYAVGDEVMGLVAGGVGHTFAERVSVPAKLLVKKPANLSHAEAAGLPLVGATALNFLQGRLQSGMRVAVVGASGGVGSFALQYAKTQGAEVIAICSERNRELVTQLGADQVIDYQNCDPAQELNQVDLLFDTIGNLDPDKYWQAMVRGGVIGSTGTGPRDMEMLVEKFGKNLWLMAGMVDGLRQKFRGKRRHGVDYRMVFGMPGGKVMREIARLAESGAVKAVIDEQFPLQQIKEAFEKSQSGRVRGKLIINIAD